MENRIKETRSLGELNPFKANPSATGQDQDLAALSPNGEIKLSDITLTAEEEKQALRDALTAKRHKISLERERTMEKIRNLDKEIRGPKTPIELWNIILGRGKELSALECWENPFVIPDFSYDYYRALCFYFTGDEEGMMHYYLSPRKGIMIFGGVGVGKSVIMKLFAKNPVQSYVVTKCAKIEVEYNEKDNTAPTIQKYSAMRHNAYKSNYYNQEALGYCFDDLGAEQPGNNYGKKDFMIDILESRYDNSQIRGPKTHITTNLTLVQISERYGPRVLDRMRQMFNLIEFPADIESLRA